MQPGISFFHCLSLIFISSLFSSSPGWWGCRAARGAVAARPWLRSPPSHQASALPYHWLSAFLKFGPRNLKTYLIFFTKSDCFQFEILHVLAVGFVDHTENSTTKFYFQILFSILWIIPALKTCTKKTYFVPWRTKRLLLVNSLCQRIDYEWPLWIIVDFSLRTAQNIFSP